MKQLNLISFTATVIIVCASAAKYFLGAQPDWFTFFIGWGFLVLAEFRQVLKDRQP